MVMKTILILWNFLVSISLTSTLMRSIENNTLSTLMMTCGHSSLIFFCLALLYDCVPQQSLI